MRSIKMLGLAIVATLAFSALASASAFATYTVKSENKSGVLQSTSGVTELKDKGTTLQCEKSEANGTIKEGTGLSGVDLAEITSTTWGNGSEECTGPLGIKFKVTQEGTWDLNATGVEGGEVTGTVTNVKAALSGSLCSFKVSGEVNKGSYNNSTHKLTVDGNGLIVSGVSGCFGLVKNEDNSEFVAEYVVANPTGLEVTSP